MPVLRSLTFPLIAVALAMLSPVTPPTSARADDYACDSSDFAREVLEAHNKVRKEHQVAPLKWDCALATTAQRHADKCVYEHSKDSEYGENIAAGYSSPTAAITAWADERTLYNFQDGGFSEGTGHFTQMVWKDTTTVGAGIALCTSIISPSVEEYYLVANYAPAGNVQGEYRENVLPQLQS